MTQVRRRGLEPGIVASLRPGFPVREFRVSQHAFQVHRDVISAEIVLGPDGGFRSVSISIDQASSVPPAHRAHPLRRAEAILEHVAQRLEDGSVRWRTISATSEDNVYRGVEVMVQLSDGLHAPLCVLLEGPGPVPAWYKGIRRLAIAGFLRLLDLREAVIRDRFLGD